MFLPRMAAVFPTVGWKHFYADDCTEPAAAGIFSKVRAGQAVTPEEASPSSLSCCTNSAVMDAEKGWTMQIHFGALRNVNSRLHRAIGTRHRV